jgi:small GTP-binding protein
MERCAITVGNASVGKTWLIRSFLHGPQSDIVPATYGPEFHKVELANGRMAIYDTAGMDTMFSMTANYVRRANIILFCFDIERRETFDCIPQWREKVDELRTPDFQPVLVGCKGDMRETTRDPVPPEDAQRLADDYGIEYFETSAKTGLCVQELLQHLTDLDISQLSQVGDADRAAGGGWCSC